MVGVDSESGSGGPDDEAADSPDGAAGSGGLRQVDADESDTVRDQRGLTFADRLNLLFAAFLRPPDELGVRKEWTNSALARAVEQLYGRQVFTPMYVSHLRRGLRKNPTLESATAIARAFEHLSKFAPEPGKQSAIVLFLALDPETADPDQLEQLESLSNELHYYIGQRDQRDHADERFGILARLGDIEDPESIAAVSRLVTRLRKKERRRLGRG